MVHIKVPSIKRQDSLEMMYDEMPKTKVGAPPDGFNRETVKRPMAMAPLDAHKPYLQKAMEIVYDLSVPPRREQPMATVTGTGKENEEHKPHLFLFRFVGKMIPFFLSNLLRANNVLNLE